MTTTPTPTPTPSPAAGRLPLSERLQFGVLVTIVLVVGLMAGAASFTHVHDWTLTNSPPGTGDWFGWANAVISELIPTAALITIARRRRTGARIGYPMFLLVAAVSLSLTAQLAVATPTVFGWVVSAVPALAFFALSKLVFTTTRPSTTPVLAPDPGTLAPAPSTTETAPAKRAPAKKSTPAKKTTPAPRKSRASRTPAKTTSPTPTETPTPTPVEVPAPAPAGARPALALPAGNPGPIGLATITSQWLPAARRVAHDHHAEHGEPINAGQLAVRLRIPTPTAAQLLSTLHRDQPTTTDQPTRPVNGTTIQGVTR